MNPFLMIGMLGAAGAAVGAGLGLANRTKSDVDADLRDSAPWESMDDEGLESNDAYLEWLEERDPGTDYFVKTNFLTGEQRAWKVQRLWDLGAKETPTRVPVKKIPQVDSPWYWSEKDQYPSIKRTAQECARVTRANLDYPIILDPNGSLMDGAHRLGKAVELGHKDILAVKLSEMPEPDEIIYF